MSFAEIGIAAILSITIVLIWSALIKYIWKRS